MSERTTAAQPKALSGGSSSRSAGLQRQCACGTHTPSGGECAECGRKKFGLQRKIMIGPSNDPLEREADQVAEQVMSASPNVSAGVASKPMRIQRFSEASAVAGGTASPASADRVLGGAGRPLEPSLRNDMEHRFGRDFSQVRVHTGRAAEQSAQGIDAVAYTYGHDIVFGAGQYSPSTAEGRRLLAHELTHVVQQSGATDLTIQRQSKRGQSSFRGQSSRPASRGAAIVEDGQPVATGQMHRSEFLRRARESLIEAADAEFRSIGRSARGCPYILRTIERYASRPVSSLMRLIQAFAHPPAGADASALLRVLAERTRTVARGISARQSPRAQAKTERGNATLQPHDPLSVRGQLGTGRALDDDTRGKMESSFGKSFASVRVHEDATAARFNAALGARAFTIGQNIAFAAGEYRPGTQAGDALIAHELAHTVQQGSGAAQTRSGAEDQYLEQQAEDAAMAVAGHGHGAIPSDLGTSGISIQRLPAVLAGAIVVAEATPEVVVVAEVATVSTEVVVVDGALVATADVAAPALIEATAPVAVEAVTPAALETTAAATSSSSALTSGTVLATAGAATTLSSDSPANEEQDRQRGCFEKNPTALPCEEEIDIEERVQEFIMRQGYGYESLGNCYPMSSVASIYACNGAPGESWHCDVDPYSDPISRTTKPGGVVSIFSCLCCRTDGQTGFEWRGQHWSPGS
jgi:hypothetical protein